MIQQIKASKKETQLLVQNIINKLLMIMRIMQENGLTDETLWIQKSLRELVEGLEEVVE